ncbi:unnamed protein product, partial [Allacma fusca]
KRTRLVIGPMPGVCWKTATTSEGFQSEYEWRPEFSQN